MCTVVHVCVTDELHVPLDRSSHLFLLTAVIEGGIPEALHTRSTTASGRPDTRHEQHTARRHSNGRQ